MRFLLGGYSADSGGDAPGIGMLVAGAPDDRLAGGPLGYAGVVAAAASPSWITADPTQDVVYAALEKQGAVQAFRRTGEASFVPLGDPVPAGEATCHVMVTPDRSALVASCWGDGRVVRMSLAADGRPHSPVVLPAAIDPYGPASESADDPDLSAAAAALREAAGPEFAHLVPGPADPPETAAGDAASDPRPSRAHQTAALANGVLVSTDMGRDLVRFWHGDADRMRPTQDVVLPRGTGPRHMVWHPSGHLYVVTELSREVFVLGWDAAAAPTRLDGRARPATAGGSGAWRIVSACSLGPTADGDTAAEIAMSRDGQHVYAGVRGSDTLATLRVRGQGETLEPVALTDAGVGGPRHHVVVRDTVLVAGRRTDDVVSMALDERTGVPGRVRQRTAAPTPTCILPLA